MRVKLKSQDLANVIIFAIFVVFGLYGVDSFKLKPYLWWISWSSVALIHSFLGVVMYPGFKQFSAENSRLKRELTAKGQEVLRRIDALENGQEILLAEFSKERLQELLNKYIVNIGEYEAYKDMPEKKETLCVLVAHIRTRLKEIENIEKRDCGFSVLVEE